MIHKLEKLVAIALKELYNCYGISSRQHNEPCGDQDVWHYHLHIFPRYMDDNLYTMNRELSTRKERIYYSNMLKIYFKNNLKDNNIELTSQI